MADIKDLLERIQNYSPSHNTYLLLSILKDEGRSGEVIKRCLNALKTYPDDISIRRLLAEAYLEKGFLGLAEEELEKITSKIHEFIPVFKIIAELYIHQGRKDEASKALYLYLAHFPQDEEALGYLKSLQAEKLSEDQPEGIDLAQYMKSETSYPQKNGAEQYSDTGSIVSEETRQELKPDHHQGQTNEHDIGISTALAEEDEFSDLSTPTLAEIYFNQGQIEEAIDTYEKVIIKNPGDQQSLARLAELKSIRDQSSEQTSIPKPDKKKKMVSILEGWLSKIQEVEPSEQ